MAIVWTSNGMQGLAADTKPTNVVSGTNFYETDTFLTFVFNGSTWDQTGGAGAETGAIESWGGGYASIPSGWLICDGAAVSRTTYADLFAVTGTFFGVGDGSTTFNVPDLRTKYPRGAPNATDPGTTGGNNTHTLTTSEMPSHGHGITDPGHDHSGRNASSSNSSGGGGPITTSGNTGTNSTGITVNNNGSGNSHNNEPSYQEVVWMIKT
jgi:microcystin-dependent protein